MQEHRLQPAPAFGSSTAEPLLLPRRFPRPVASNCLTYLQEYLESGLRADMLTRFELSFARELGIKHCVGTSGCTAALMALAAALDFADGDEIIVSSISDYGTVMGLIKERYIPVFADTAPGSINIDSEQIERCITPRTRAIFVTHMMGLPCDMDRIVDVATRNGLSVYEDVCQGVFGEYKGQLLGTLGHAAAFSFDVEKTLSSDVGGCIVTNDDHLARALRFHGQYRGQREVKGFGRVHESNAYQLRMAQSTAAIALGQLEAARPRISELDLRIRFLYGILSDVPGISPVTIPDYATVCSCWMAGFVLDPSQFTCNSEEFARQLREEGISDAGLGTYYLLPESLRFLRESSENETYPFSMPPASARHIYGAQTCPNARNFLENFIRWSSFSESYSNEDCLLAANIVRRVTNRNRA